MKAHAQYQITMYYRRPVNRNTKQNNERWLRAIMPFIISTRPLIADKIVLKDTNESIMLCLS